MLHPPEEGGLRTALTWRLTAALTRNSLEPVGDLLTATLLTPPPVIKAQTPVGLNSSPGVDHMIATPSPLTDREIPLICADFGAHHHDHSKPRRCDSCSGIWCDHLECIWSASINREDDQRQAQLRSSYDNLRLHIKEHILNSCATCSLCEDLFFHHILQLQLLFEVHLTEVGQVRLAVGNSLMSLRKHVEEVHRRF